MLDLVSVAFVYKSTLNMAAPLSNCITVEQRAVIHFLWSEGVTNIGAGDSQQVKTFFCPWGFLLLHDNARSHSAAAKVRATRPQKFELLLSHHMVQT
jgi:hypothetical protein